MAYNNDYNFGNDYSNYTGNYYGYQVGIIFAILIAGLIILAIFAAVIYFGCVKGMRRNEKQRRLDSRSSTGRSSVQHPWQPTVATYCEKPSTTYDHRANGYSPDQETPILQSSVHSQVAYRPPPPTYIPQQTYLQQKEQSLKGTYSHPEESSSWNESVAIASQQHHVTSSEAAIHTSSV